MRHPLAAAALAAAFVLGAAAARADCPPQYFSASGQIQTGGCGPVVFNGASPATLSLPPRSWQGSIINTGSAAATVIGAGGAPVNGTAGGSVSVGANTGAVVSGDPSAGWWVLATGGGTGTGTVTSVGLSAPSWLTVGGSPVTSTGTLALTGTSEPANEVLASPNGSVGAMTPRALVAADIPSLSYNGVVTWPTSGDLMLSNGGNAPTAYVGSSCSGSQFATGLSASGTIICGTPSGSGNVSSSGTIASGALAVWNSATTVVGTLTPTNNDLVYATGGAFGNLATTASGLLVTSSSGVPSIAAWPTSGDLMLSNPGGAPTAYGGASCTNQALTALSAAGTATCSSITSAYISGSITAAQMLGLAAGDIYQGNGSNQPAAVTLSGAIDAAIGSTRGSILERGASGWALLAPSSTSGYVLTSNGTGADPSYQASGGGSTTITLAPGLGSSQTSFNGTGTAQTVTNASTLYPNVGSYAVTAAYSLNQTTGTTPCSAGVLCDTARLILADGSGSIAITAPNPAGTLAPYQIADEAGHGFTVSAGGTATFFGCVSGSPTTLPVPPGYAVQLFDQGSSANTYFCTFQSGSGSIPVGLTHFDIGYISGVNPNGVVITAVVPQTMTIAGMTGLVATASGVSGTTVSIYEAPSGTACASGTNLTNSTSFNANGTASTSQALAGTTATITANDYLCLVTAGTWTSSVGVGTITIWVHP